MLKENNKALYIQIAEGICDRVMAGSFVEGERIPSVREYGATLQVNANTVVRSYEYLSQEGIIYNKRGIGYFISEDAREKIEALRHETFFNGEMQTFFKRLNQLGVSPDDLYAHYVKYLEEEQK